MYQICAYFCDISKNVTSITKMSRKPEDNSAKGRQSYSRLTGKRTFKEDIYKFLQDFKVEQFAVLEKLTNEIIGLRDGLHETKNESHKKQIKNKNGITYAELQFEPFEERKKMKEENICQLKSVYQLPLQQNNRNPLPFEADLHRKVENLTKENEIFTKRIDILQNQLNLLQQKLQELETKEDRIREKDMLVQTITDCCQNISYQHYRDISHTIMAFWEGNAHLFIYLFLHIRKCYPLIFINRVL